MHEFSICQAIITKIKIIVTNNHNLIKIKLIIGELANIDTASLKFWFPLVAKESALPDFILDIEIQPGKAVCDECDKQFQIHSYVEGCPACSSYKRSILEGQDLLMQILEVE
jgi:hydrogenase nickel incorporation protein HypA/HybF